MTFDEEMAGFFNAYVVAFAGSDADALIEMLDRVALSPSPTGNFAVERPAFRDHCVTLMEFYRQQGVIRPEGELLSATELFPDVAQARIAYRMYGQRDALIAEWTHVYILRRTDRWRVSLSIADGEMAAWVAKSDQL
ncbi:hypothetical protein ACNI3Q_00260 [Sphingomonas sp. FW199]|uniref:hypothetical protein n=1 Tax=Sphingomonas sp. FW199 TaxID=3400217 RepID=UPI003CF833F8